VVAKRAFVDVIPSEYRDRQKRFCVGHVSPGILLLKARDVVCVAALMIFRSAP
jgi:hypothetical protein